MLYSLTVDRKKKHDGSDDDDSDPEWRPRRKRHETRNEGKRVGQPIRKRKDESMHILHYVTEHQSFHAVSLDAKIFVFCVICEFTFHVYTMHTYPSN
jgi:hypothetical protein